MARSDPLEQQANQSLQRVVQGGHPLLMPTPHQTKERGTEALRNRGFLFQLDVQSCGIYDISTLPGDVVLRPHSGRADRFWSCLLVD